MSEDIFTLVVAGSVGAAAAIIMIANVYRWWIGGYINTAEERIMKVSKSFVEMEKEYKNAISAIDDALQQFKLDFGNLRYDVEDMKKSLYRFKQVHDKLTSLEERVERIERDMDWNVYD